MAFPSRVPYLNQSTYEGYCGILALEIVAGTLYFAVNMTIASLFLGLGLFFNAFSIQFASMFQHMSDLVSTDQTHGSMVELKRYLIETITFHNKTKE